MAAEKKIKSVEKKTRQNGSKTATMNKHVKRSFKKYRGQGK
jgi:hypothetical protein